MPLVVLCGLPASGKTHVAEALVSFLRAREGEGIDVVHVTEASVNITRRDGYKGAWRRCCLSGSRGLLMARWCRLHPDAREEKNARSALRAAAELSVSSKTVVVLDALNYIKGSRYELFCKARAENTTYCVVFVDTPLALALERNAGRADRFDPQL